MAEGGQQWRGGNEDTVGLKALSVVRPFLLILLYGWMWNWKGERFLDLFFSFSLCLNFLQVMTLPLSLSLSLAHTSHSYGVRKVGFLALLPPPPPLPSSFTLRLAQQVEVRTPPPESSRWHMVAQPHMSGCSPPPGLLMAASWPPSPPYSSPRAVGTTPPPPPLAGAFCCFGVTQISGFCCEGHRSVRLTHFQLTDTIIHCLYWGLLCVCVCVCACVRRRNSAC